ncbi:MAG: cell division protein ZapE [Pseudomonadota bacterium]
MNIKIADKKNGEKISLDSAQLIVFNQLANLQKQLIKLFKKNSTRLAIKNLFFQQQTIKSLYIYGKVGRGKSMLMRNFFENLPTNKKIYFHFNSFMQEVHKELHRLRVVSRKSLVVSGADLISLATKKVIGEAKVLCFDEMQIEDVADAMILQGVFNYFLQAQIIVITTSNCHPLELYENGLQREAFLKSFVHEVLLKNFVILNLDGKVDYRSQFISSKQHYFYPNNSENKKTVLDMFIKTIDQSQPAPREIEVLGRKIVVKNSYKNIALFDFKDLCGADLGVADYQAIIKEFALIFLLGVPILKAEDRNEAKRLIWFIDEVYERKIGLVVLAESKPEEIYVKGIGAKAFKRTASRLNEI